MNDGGKFATPQELKMARLPAVQRAQSGERTGEEVSSVFMPVEDLYWIKDSLHNLRKDKADRTFLMASIQTYEEKLEIINIRLDEISHCKKETDFLELKEAVNSWRTFFRNIVAVGSIGVLVVIGGWLWQYYTIVSQVTKTSEIIIQVSQSTETLRSNYEKYRQEHFAESVKALAENDAKFVRLEYKLLSAISQLSQGVTLIEPEKPKAPLKK
jgi:hypothetical protein